MPLSLRPILSRRGHLVPQVSSGTTPIFRSQPPFQRSMMASNSKRPPFKDVEASRPKWDFENSFHMIQTARPDWTFGDGAQQPRSKHGHVTIDPYEAGRPKTLNYKLLISAVAPRPIAFLSTRSADGSSSTNLAPFSYFNVVSSDPPLFVVGITGAVEGGKDTLRNIVESRECVLNIISEHFLEAANSTSINAPYGVSEWDVAGLTPAYDCETVKCARVAEAIFSVEAKLDSYKEYESRFEPGKISSTVITLEGTRFWVREDALNEEKSLIDPAILSPVGRFGGITFTRTAEGMEIPRPDFERDVGGYEGLEKLKKQTNGNSTNGNSTNGNSTNGVNGH